jgi:hypothetical protein
MNLLRLLVLVASLGIACILISAGMRVVLHRQRARTAALHGEVAEARFETRLSAARWYKTNGNLWGDDRSWFSLRGPTQLIVGAEAFIISAPKAFSEFAFKGCECSISLSKAPSSPFKERDWIVISGIGTTPLGSGRQAQLAISHDKLSEIWRALAAAGAAQH